MKEIIIKIPDNLTKQEEAIFIGKALMKKSLTGGGTNKDQKRIGTEVNVIDLETKIIIQRVNKDKPIEFVLCNVCQTEYQSNAAKFFYTNYGGMVRKRPCCSDACADKFVSEFPGGRVVRKKSDIKPFRFY